VKPGVPLLLFCAAACAWSQDASRAAPDPAKAAPPAAPQPAHQNKRILWIIPNNRTSPIPKVYKPLTAREKFHLAWSDSVDPGTFALAAALAGLDQWSNAHPSFGQGMAGYGRRFGTNYADIFIGDFFTTAIFPTLLHQDPRYFRMGEGHSGWSRLGHSLKQIFWTRTDSGGHAVNVSELLGNGVAVGISNAYYPDDRTASGNLGRWGTQIGLDMTGNVLKEFWPDIMRKMHHGKGATP
jgi:hypothetical protein